MSSPAIDTASDDKAFWVRQAGRLMRTQPRRSWLIPLLAVPLSQVALSPACTPDVFARCAPDVDSATMRSKAATVAGIVHAISASNGTRGLTDDQAWLLVEFCHEYFRLRCAGLLPPAFLLAGMDLLPDLRGEPLLRTVAKWVDSGAVPVPLAVFIASRALPMSTHPPTLLPRIDGYYAGFSRAMDSRLQAEGIMTWEDALAFAATFWSGTGWCDLSLWQASALHRLLTNDMYKTERQREAEALEKERRLHRAERKRLQEAVAQAKHELCRLRPIGAKVDGLRGEAERLRRREGELIQSRDRAVARTRALEAANEELERECRAARHRLAVVTPEPAETNPGDDPHPSMPALEAEELPNRLLAGRTVFYFTGELRRSSAEAAGQSLRALGADEIRTFCLRQGSDGPDGYPTDALVVADFRFAGHSQSGLIQARAARSGAQFLSVRSGKGSLVRKVAKALVKPKQLGG